MFGWKFLTKFPQKYPGRDATLLTTQTPLTPVRAEISKGLQATTGLEQATTGCDQQWAPGSSDTSDTPLRAPQTPLTTRFGPRAWFKAQSGTDITKSKVMTW